MAKLLDFSRFLSYQHHKGGYTKQTTNNSLIEKGILTLSNEISTDKINLVAGAIMQPFTEMVWVTTGGDMDTITH